MTAISAGTARRGHDEESVPTDRSWQIQRHTRDLQLDGQTHLTHRSERRSRNEGESQEVCLQVRIWNPQLTLLLPASHFRQVESHPGIAANPGHLLRLAFP